MSIIIGSNGMHYTDHMVFLRFNPWFKSYYHDMFMEQLNSNSAERRINSIVTDKINSLFPSLWRHHMLNDVEWQRFREKLDDQTNLGLLNLRNKEMSCLAAIQSATDKRVFELLETKEFGTLKSAIVDATNLKYNLLDQDLRTKFSANESLRFQEVQNNKKELSIIKEELKNVKSNQGVMFIGGIFVGATGAALSFLLTK